jgi:hypothetical protein
MGRSKVNGEGNEIHQVPVSTLYRWYLYDIIGDDADSHVDIFKLSHVSSEGHEKELEDSELRILEIEPLFPFLSLYAGMNAEYSYEVHKAQMMKIPGISESMIESSSDNLKEFYSNLAFNALTAALAAAVDLKLVELRGLFTGIKEQEDE